MPRKQRKVKEDNEEEIHPDFTSDTVPDSPSNSNSDNLNRPIDNNSDNLDTSDDLYGLRSQYESDPENIEELVKEAQEERSRDNIENSINETSDNSTNINYGDDESGAQTTSDNYDPGIVSEDE